MRSTEPDWQFHRFETLNTLSLFELLKLRVNVFVVEQECAYPELDEHDKAPYTLHLLGYENKQEGKQLIAYARAMPPASLAASVTEQADTAAVRIGRVVVEKKHRGSGVAQRLMQRLIERLQSDYSGRDQELAAQTSVQGFYAAMGFVPISDVYTEDGIEHIDMRRTFAPLVIRC